MSELRDDDAPITTSKRDGTIRDAIENLVEAKGDSLVGRSVTIRRPREELYAYWRDFRQLPSFMDNVERVDVIDDATSHWVVKAPGGKTVEWDAVITEERPNELIAGRPRKARTCPTVAGSTSAMRASAERW